MAAAGVEFEIVEVENPDGLNLIFGQTHFIKTVEGGNLPDSTSYSSFTHLQMSTKL